mmetsp:Transcript_45970/g.73955  ORF Transcript_45970/g.73955 Transcript_45970/m.73955 type:complete len:89 (-) Transcript_45970:3-269(-)
MNELESSTREITEITRYSCHGIKINRVVKADHIFAMTMNRDSQRNFVGYVIFWPHLLTNLATTKINMMKLTPNKAASNVRAADNIAGR